GSPVYQYSLNGAAFVNTGIFNNLPSGSDTIIVRDQNDCRVTLTTTITQPTAGLSASISSQINVDCHGNSNGALTANATGGTPAYQYSIDNQQTWHSSGTFTGLAGGTYIVDVRDSNGCTSQTTA